ncbi:MAG: GntR family transcriptional regulator [Pseudomonadota bacterium]
MEMGPQFGTRGLIARPALAVEVADALRELILEGELAGGEKIREKELTERFGVSRTPLREAMKMLASEGLIELIPNRGAIITIVSDEMLADAFPVLAALEGLAGSHAAERATDEELAHIAELTATLREALESEDRLRYFRINQSIHSAILAASRNETLIRSHAAVAGQVHRARYQANLARTRWERAVAEHDMISEALNARDVDRVRELLEAHMMGKLTSVLSAREDEAKA